MEFEVIAAVAVILVVLVIGLIIGLFARSRTTNKIAIQLLETKKQLSLTELQQDELRRELTIAKQEHDSVVSFEQQILDLKEQLAFARLHEQDKDEEHQKHLDEKQLEYHTLLDEKQKSHELEIQRIKEEEEEKRKQAKTLGESVMKGEIMQVRGSFKIVAEYEHFSLITSVSKQASFDGIGIKEDKLDFIEFKSPGARLSGKEGKVKKLISNGQVGYRVIDVETDDINLKDRD